MFSELIDNGSLGALLNSVGSLLLIIYGGESLLTLVVAIAARIGVVPLLEAVARVREGGGVHGLARRARVQ